MPSVVTAGAEHEGHLPKMTRIREGMGHPQATVGTAPCHSGGPGNLPGIEGKEVKGHRMGHTQGGH